VLLGLKPVDMRLEVLMRTAAEEKFGGTLLDLGEGERPLLDLDPGLHGGQDQTDGGQTSDDPAVEEHKVK
jgi:hypothetical protein